ncbi:MULTISPECIES: hypothetical protein [Acinetobacter]|uniref:Sugar porter family MFS transporter n=2 Tax=Acinetobacter baumannii TaxID=470 RepID=A0AAP1FCA2_ACIBA|nr:MULTISPECIES: hypothetical protein [Acinetobacter]AIL79159.1 hypothetical protein IX87_11150 [Acinetobacter baumannii]AIS07750.1 hypothetical protein LX00_15590 [Acinetobacter baumannii]ANA38473.1 hypothetical protein AWN74_12815 [Acinetobacter baumannii]APJ18175.1 hypothetical protein BS064_03325 [Acinetobacter baumannii]ATD20035.1 hypothetical protein BS098_09080 [Acinetobacter baumannii]
MSDKNSSESAILGWKFVLIVGVLSAIFLGFFYLAMSNEPDYMPRAQRKAQQHEMQQKAEKSTDQQTQHDNMPEMDMQEHQHSHQ